MENELWLKAFLSGGGAVAIAQRARRPKPMSLVRRGRTGSNQPHYFLNDRLPENRLALPVL
uniref:Uncharacterized protein n=1 Tax=Anguilla anguilla TaxID=7936 RepID=A0A0E9P6I1_ANGAN